jgi:hypothetical protein
MVCEQPYWKIYGLNPPTLKSGFPRVSIRFNEGGDGWLSIDYTEFCCRLQRLKRDVGAESDYLNEGYEIRLGYGSCILTEIAEQMEVKQYKKRDRSRDKEIEIIPDENKPRQTSLF